MQLGISALRALVVGGSRGLGFATAAALAEEGVEVTLAARSEESLASAARTLGARYVVADIAREGAGLALARAVGPVDILVLNAGGPANSGWQGFAGPHLDEAVGKVLRPMVELVEAVAPGMAERGFGRIVSISSYVVREPDPEMVPSDVARVGLVAYLRAAATELAPHGVTVNSVLPGLHATERLIALEEAGVDLARMRDRVPGGTIGDPGDFGRVVAMLCARFAGYVTGQTIAVDGGATRGLL